jgi:PTS system nitrogen regulatory IIA component
MQLSVRDAAAILNVSDKTIYRWIGQGRLPAYKINEQIRFNRAELLEWATAKKINVSVDIFEQDATSTEPAPTLAGALNAGGIYYRICGTDVKSALSAMVNVVPIPEDVDRDFLLQVLLARESLASTGVGNGISIPHPRNPIIAAGNAPMLCLCFLDQPVDFHALDGKPVHTLFVVLTPTLRSHLNLVSRLSFALMQPAFRQAVQDQANRQTLLAAAAAVDSLVSAPQAQPEMIS